MKQLRVEVGLDHFFRKFTNARTTHTLYVNQKFANAMHDFIILCMQQTTHVFDYYSVNFYVTIMR